MAVDKIGVVVGVDGVADKVRESVHPAFASWLSSTTGGGDSVSSVGSRWSGNAFLDHVCDEDTEYPYAYDPSANEMSARGVHPSSSSTDVRPGGGSLVPPAGETTRATLIHRD